MSKEPEELKEDKGGEEGGELGRPGGRQHSLIPTTVQGSGDSAWALRPERLGSQGLNLPFHHGTDGRSSDRDSFLRPLSLAGQGSRTVREGWAWCHCPYPGDSEETGSPMAQALKPRRQELLGCSFH